VCLLQSNATAENESFLHQKKQPLDNVESNHLYSHHADKDIPYTHRDTDNMKDSLSSSYAGHSSSMYESEVPLGGSAHSLRNQLSARPQSPRQLRQLVSAKPALSSYMDPRAAAVAVSSQERPLAYEYTSHGGIRQMSPPTMYRGGTATAAAVLASDEKYPLMQSATSGDNTARTKPPAVASTRPPMVAAAGLPRYGSPTFPPPTARDVAAANRPIPLSVAASGVHNVAGAVRRPVSFVRAVEQSDQLAVAARPPPGAARVAAGAVLQTTSELDERTAAASATASSAYGSSYEIAV